MSSWMYNGKGNIEKNKIPAKLIPFAVK
jgi:hypothetical protein